MIVAKIYYQQQPDYIPFKHGGQLYFETLKKLCESQGKFYADRSGLKTISKIQVVLEKILGLFGRKDHTSIPNVEYGLAKFLYYGYAQGYTRNKAFKPWLASLETRTKKIAFSTTMRSMMELLQNSPDLSLRESLRFKLENHLTAIYAHYSHRIGPIGEKTRILSEASPSFGTAPIALAEFAIEKGDWSRAIAYAENAYQLRIAKSYEAIGDLFLKIVKIMPRSHSAIENRLKEFRDHALSKHQDLRALHFEEALTAFQETDPQIILRFAYVADSEEKALDYLKRVDCSSSELRDEKQKIYSALLEQALLKNLPQAALKYYELAVKHGAPYKPLEHADLHLQAAMTSARIEEKKFSWLQTKDFSEAIHHFKEATTLFEKEGKLLPKLFEGDWVELYLTALKEHGRLKEGLDLITREASTLYESFKEPDASYQNYEEKRIAYIEEIEPYLQKIFKLYEIAVRFDPKNGEHYFQLANLTDYLSYIHDYTNPMHYFLKAAECDPENNYYRVGVVQAAIRQGKTPPDWCVAELASQPQISWWFEMGWRFQKANIRTGRAMPRD